MKKADLVEMVSKKLDVPAARADMVVSTTIDCIGEVLEKGGELRIKDFGTFRVKEMKARKARNPKTGTPVEVPARKKVAFRATGRLKEAFQQ